MNLSRQEFVLPKNLSVEEQIGFCKEVVNKYRREVKPLRAQLSTSQRQNTILEKATKLWEEKYRKSQEELKKVKEENKKLKREITKLTKTNKRYQIALFDHGNFTHPDRKDKKAKGGQPGHSDTNREKQEDYKTYGHKRIFAKACGKCGRSLTRVNSLRKKILLDIVINPEIVKLIIESERQWCSNCQEEVVARDQQTLPFSEYGMNTFLMTLILRFQSHASFANIASVIRVGYGLSLSHSDVSNLLKTAAKYLKKHYEELKEAVRKGAVMYNDETGWLVHGQKAWMWIMTNETATVYVAAESRGKGIFKDMYGNSNAYSMHDGYAGYESVTGGEKTLYCWTHVLRFSFEETIHLEEEHLACVIRDRLVNLYQLMRSQRTWSKAQKEAMLRKEIECILTVGSEDQTVKNIQHRVQTQKEGLILALLITEDGTNNLSERELRNMAIKRTISHGSDTYKGMETTAIIGSILQTINRNKEAPFIPALQTYLTEGIREKYKQYLHVPYSDS